MKNGKRPRPAPVFVVIACFIIICHRQDNGMTLEKVKGLIRGNILTFVNLLPPMIFQKGSSRNSSISLGFDTR